MGGSGGRSCGNSGRSFLLLRNIFDKGQQNIVSPAKRTRSSTRGDIGLQSTERGKR
jgi:hypothetical protein